MGYNVAIWHGCRRFGVEFLREAKERLVGRADPIFDEAISHYTVVADRLRKVSELYPWSPIGGGAVIPVDDACGKAVALLKDAREAEAAGLVRLGMIAAVL